MYLGIDECGLGSLAGTLTVAGCVIEDGVVEGVTDSKKLNRKQIIILSKQVLSEAKWHKIVDVPPDEIDLFGIGRCWQLAVQEILLCCDRWVSTVRGNGKERKAIIDGSRKIIFPGWTIQAIPKADSTCYAVSAASIIAKDHRDTYMQEVADKKYPKYGFKHHVGYGTAEHSEAIGKHGPCEIHRYSFAPIKYDYERKFRVEFNRNEAENMLKVIMQQRKRFEIYNLYERRFLAEIAEKLNEKSRLSPRQAAYLDKLHSRTFKFIGG